MLKQNVQVLYRRDNVDELFDLTPHIRGCEQGCSLEQFKTRSLPFKQEPDQETVGLCLNANQHCFPPIAALQKATRLPTGQHRTGMDFSCSMAEAQLDRFGLWRRC